MFNTNLDKHNMIGILDQFHEQCNYAMTLAKNINVKGSLNGIIVAGMGGSAIAGDLVRCYIKEGIPFVLPRSYHLPDWVNKNTLVFVVSYSGNTEETIAMYEEAKRKACTIIVISSGGKLKQKALREKMPYVEVPTGLPPREAVGYQAIPMLTILEQSGIVGPCQDMKTLIPILKKHNKEQSKEIAKRLMNKIPLIYASQEMSCLANIWKIKMNENAKIQSFAHVIPEMNHTEIQGFDNLLTDYFVIILQDEEDHPQIKKRMEITKQILQEKNIPALLVRITGKNRLARLFSSLLMASYVSYYLALIYKTDPFPFPTIEAFKKQLKQKSRMF